MLDPIVKQKWVDALRSGKYIQGEGALRTVKYDGTVCNCCLGVLAEVNGVTFHEQGKGQYYYDFDSDDNGLSADVETPNEYCGLSDTARDRLIQMNDGNNWEIEKCSFAEIATYIEENL